MDDVHEAHREGWAGRSVQTILVVDDDPAIRTLLVAALGGPGRRVVEAADGAAALEAARRWRPDLVLLDVGLPGLDGFGVCERLRADPATSHAPVWFLTARTGDADRARGLAVGGEQYLAKPFSPVALRAMVEKELGPPMA